MAKNYNRGDTNRPPARAKAKPSNRYSGNHMNVAFGREAGPGRWKPHGPGGIK